MNRESKSEMVRVMFNDIAPTYDRLNHILSLDIDRLWRKRVVRVVRKLGAKHIMDMATGTGDLAIALAKKIDGATIYGADFSSEMLAVAKQKIEQLGLAERISLTECNAENIPLADEAVDAATVAFGVRNFEHQREALTEIKRTIRRGGHLVVLEFSNPRFAIVRWCYRLYSHHILPAIGRLVSKHATAYTYLPESIDQFASPDAFTALLREVGFDKVERKSQSFGIAHIYIAHKAE
ncbi:MAG: bifunctional demethylmenaquinone methyltransferase/2-methoxy-6-polyprenyl-1,4-benzoquinol methylase UbiE [Rikenellaceae bacterium]|nr:bifunctional demethylmenaquinone methyltransferase/2-methoxy-6-polyprenyl-1,4-benzoquinol methylase UbiE [Rikenellaceae bacterium]